MTDHPGFEELGDLLDGTLPSARAADLRGHLDRCADCRELYDALTQTVSRAATLPREIAPPPDLWSDIRGQLVPRARFAGSRFGVRGLAAAGLLAAALGSGITALLLRPAQQHGSVAANPTTRGSTAVPVVLTSAERRYLESAARLEAILAERRDSLAPATVATVEQSLRIADSAIAEARGALERDPANRAIEAILASNYERKIDLLRRANELSPRT